MCTVSRRESDDGIVELRFQSKDVICGAGYPTVGKRWSKRGHIVYANGEEGFKTGGEGLEREEICDGRRDARED